MGKTISRKLLIFIIVWIVCSFLIVITRKYYEVLPDRFVDVGWFDEAANYLKLISFWDYNVGRQIFLVSFFLSLVVTLLVISYKYKRIILPIIILFIVCFFAYLFSIRPYGITWRLNKIVVNGNSITIPDWYKRTLKFNPADNYEGITIDGNQMYGKISFSENGMICFKNRIRYMVAHFWMDSTRNKIEKEINNLRSSHENCAEFKRRGDSLFLKYRSNNLTEIYVNNGFYENAKP